MVKGDDLFGDMVVKVVVSYVNKLAAFGLC